MQARRLTLTADDFGRSPAVNAEIERWFRAGALTQAGLMVCEPHAHAALDVARRNPGLRLGLHLTLCDGHASDGATMTRSPALAGLRFAFWPGARAWLRREIAAQFTRFREFGLPPTYWDGHAHLHLHPVVLGITLPIAREHGFHFTRLVREPGPPALLPWVFNRLSALAAPRLRGAGIGFPDAVIGLRKTGQMGIAEFHRALCQDGDTEIYFHPGAETTLPQPEEVAALLNRTTRPPDQTPARRS
jgi:chitin disaccharide deacetylase